MNTREELIAPDVKVRLIFCPPGKFTMGQGPTAREVTLTQGFWLGEAEISRGQWKAVMGKRQGWTEPGTARASGSGELRTTSPAGADSFQDSIQGPPGCRQFSCDRSAMGVTPARAGCIDGVFLGR